jgi:sensor histidine kinase YesM
MSNREPFFGGVRYWIIIGIVSIPVFLLMQLLVKKIEFPEDEAMSFGLTVGVITGVFVGRYLGAIWAFRKKSISTSTYVKLLLIDAVLIFWIFFYADFPLRDRITISIFLFAIPLLIASVIAGIIIKLVRAVTQRQINDARASAAHSESELQLLQSQISPHFLFNTLNNMYGLSITQQDKIPPLLLKLSDLLRYSVYDASKPFVPIKEELDYVNNYIDFEKIRIGDRLSLTTDFEDFSMNSARIAPMLLIVFVENAFKHSKNTADEKIFIHIALKTWENRILFSIVNSYGKERNSMVSEHNGLGLDNVKKRLQLLYPDNHHLVIEDNNNTYKVMLQLKVK